MSFIKCIEPLLQNEGGYVDHKDDSGGATNYGITERVARAHGFKGHMRDLPRDVAIAIYKAQYWDVLSLDKVHLVAPLVAEELFDTCVNMGVGTAGKFLQRCLNVLNSKATLFKDLPVDGVVGPMTLAALGDYMRKRGAGGERVLLKALNCLQGAEYIRLCEVAEKNESFLYGWLSNRVTF